MSAPMTPERLAEIAARAEAATKGPWGIYDEVSGRMDIAADLQETKYGYSCRRGIAQIDEEPIDNDPEHANWDTADDQAQCLADGLFIAAAREDVPALLAEVERMAARIAELEAERHTTNEALTKAIEENRAKDQRLTELEAMEATVTDFVAQRAQYITAIRNCHPDNGHDYDRWQGHAAARRELAQYLGLPVAWPEEAVSK